MCFNYCKNVVGFVRVCGLIAATTRSVFDRVRDLNSAKNAVLVKRRSRTHFSVHAVENEFRSAFPTSIRIVSQFRDENVESYLKKTSSNGRNDSFCAKPNLGVRGRYVFVSSAESIVL